MSDPKTFIPRLYGRRQDKPLKPRQARLMETLLPSVAIADIGDQSNIDPAQFFDGAISEIWLEIGFGGGEHLAWQAVRHPNVGMIGIEPFINGVAKLVSQIDEEGIGNIRILHGDARPFIGALAPASLTRLFVLHPDPWPKKRHHKRRIVSPWFFQQAARLLRPGAELRITSDIPDYIRWALMHAQAAPEFVWQAERAADWTQPPDDWPLTRYAKKALREGRPPVYLSFTRL